MQITKSDIKNYMSSSDFSRGQTYFTQGKVTQCFIKSDTYNHLVLNGIVKGSYGSRYLQSIIINRVNNFTISGNCTCPVGYNCKHVVAVCLEYALDGKTKSNIQTSLAKKKNELDKWLAEFEDENDDEFEENTNDYFVTYRLYGKDRGRDQLKFYKSKYLKNGELGKGTLLDGYKFIESYYMFR